MKKFLLLASGAALAFSAGASLQEPISAQKSFTPQKGEGVQVNTTKEVAYKAPRKVNTEDGKYELIPLIQMPTVPFYMSGLTGQDGSFAPLPVPANTEVKYTGNTWVARNNAETPKFEDFENISYDWSYINPATWLKDDVLTSTGESVNLLYTPDSFMGTLPIPTATMKYQDVKEAMTAPYKVVIGGNGTLPLLGESGNVEATEVGYNTTVMIDGINFDERACAEARFGSNRYTDTQQTFTEGTADWGMERYAEDFEASTKQPLKEVKMKGIGFNLPYAGGEYLLKSLSLGCWSIFKADVDFDINVYEADEDGYPVGDPVYSTTSTCPKTKNEEGYMYASFIDVNFKSLDEEGMSVGYIVVDKPLVVMISGFIKNEDIAMFSPWSIGYDEEANDNILEIPYTAFTVMDLIGEEGAKVENLQNYFNLWRFGKKDSEGKAIYYRYKSYYVDIQAEYPYLQISDLYIGDSTTSETVEYAPDGNYVINISDNGDPVAAVLNTSAGDAAEVFFDDEELPEWLNVEVAAAINYVTSNGGMANFLELDFSFNEGFKGQECTLPVFYKNLKINITLKNKQEDPGPGAVDNIVVDGEAQFFDLQGRKLNGNPEKGVYILKQGNKTSKVIL